MKKSLLNAIVDSLAFMMFALLTSTGVILHYLLPPRSGHGLILWGLNRHEWGGVHFLVSVLLLVVLTFHIVLHWRWILCELRGRSANNSGIRVMLGIISLIGILLLAFAPLASDVEHAADSVHYQGQLKKGDARFVHD